MAANEVKGEFTLTCGGETFTLKLGINELCIAEGMLEQTSGEFAPRLGNGNMRTLRTVLWCALRTYHQDVDIDGAGDIITELGPNAVAAVLISGISKTFPPAPTPAKGKGGASGDARPRVRATATA